MDAENPQPESGIKNLQLHVPFPDKFVYANVSGLSISAMDVRIGFAEIHPDGTPESKVGVVIPPEHAAQLALQLLEQLMLFELNFGEIRHPQWRALRPHNKSYIEAIHKARAVQEPEGGKPE